MTSRHLITSALPYINGVKHLGNLIGSMLPADVYARYLRQQGLDVLLLCATDEHGTPTELAAQAAGQSPSAFCNEQYAIQADLMRKWSLSFDHFGRSSSRENRELTQHFARVLHAQGLVETRTTKQAYSPTDGRFLPDRYVEGECPNCGYENARGDQCESCTRVLDPEELISPRSAVSGAVDVEFRESTHLFLLQSKLAETLRAWINEQHTWPHLARSIALKWLDEGLEDRCITRDLEWGVPVPEDTWPELAGKVFYVWFDAPIEYIAAGQEWAAADPEHRDWKSWWYEASDEVIYTEFMAKDNVPFHTISFPVTLIGSQELWKRVDYLKSFNWLTYYGGKFSTSQHRGVFMNDALDLLPADVWRYTLLANAPESDDSDFTWEILENAVNKDLVGTYGNFVNRVLRFSQSKFGGVVPAGSALTSRETQLIDDVEIAVAQLTAEMDALNFRKSMHALRRVWTLGNVYINDAAPWTMFKTDPDAAARVVRTCFGLVRLFAHLSAPMMPNISRQVLETVGDEPVFVWPNSELVTAWLTEFPVGRPFEVPEVLFVKLESEQLDGWRQRFGGK